MPEAGHSAVLGTAGSGKTTLALYRAAYLSAPDMPHHGRTLLLTFNQALVTYLNFLKPPELRNVTVEAYHKFARGYLNARGKMEYDTICGPDQKRRLVRLFEEFGICFSKSQHIEMLKEMEKARAIKVERIPPKTKTGHPRTAWDHKSQEYKLFIEKGDQQWQPNLI